MMDAKDDDNVDVIAKQAMDNAMGNANFGAAGDRTTYGNAEGRGILEELAEMKAHIKRMQSSNEARFKRMESSNEARFTNL